jgi:hypothetical protein
MSGFCSYTSWSKPAEEAVWAEVAGIEVLVVVPASRKRQKNRKSEELEDLQFSQRSRKSEKPERPKKRNVCETPI